MQTKVNLLIMGEEYHLVEKVNAVLIMALLEMLQFLLLIIVHHLILIIQEITFDYYVKDQPKVSMGVLVQHKKILVLT